MAKRGTNNVKGQKSPVTIGIERVDTDVAKAWLKKMGPNRKISRRNMERLVNAMVCNEWEDNAETIKFDNSGRLIDGQHRLQAIIQSGRTLHLHVARGMSPKAFDTLDQGKRRNLTDVLMMHGEKLYIHLGGAIRWFEVYRSKKGLRGIQLSNVEGMEVFRNHPGLARSVDFVSNDCKANQLFTAGLASGMHYAMSRATSVKVANSYWLAIGLGEDLKKGSPLLQFRNALISNRANPLKMQRMHNYALILKSFNAWREKTGRYPT